MRRRTRRSRNRIGTVVVVALLAIASFLIGWLARGWQLGPDIGLLVQVRRYLLSEAYPQPAPSSEELSYAAARGMVDEFGDPYSAFIAPPMSYRAQDDFRGELGVVGLYAEKHNGDMVVEVVFPGEPAEQVGILPGDVIVSVDGIPLTEATNEVEATLLMRGPVGAPARIVVRRGANTLEFGPIREPWSKVSSEMMGTIGYIRQETFTTDTADLVKSALQGLLAQKPDAIIWDLRSNGGGSMDTAQAILNYFIGRGVLFTAEQSRGRTKEFRADKSRVIDDSVPLVVLIGERTYSAAEAAAATVSDTGRGITIGSTTYGKGTIHAAIPLPDDSILQLTIAKWLSPTGEWYDGQGVEPDIAVEDDPTTQEDEVLQHAIDYILQGFPSSGPAG